MTREEAIKIQKYGNGGSLTDVDPKDYAALVTEVEGLTDA